MAAKVKNRRSRGRISPERIRRCSLHLPDNEVHRVKDTLLQPSALERAAGRLFLSPA